MSKVVHKESHMQLLSEVFVKTGVSAASLERILELPQGTLANEKLMSRPESIALLKVLRTFPWLVDVSEVGYDTERAKNIMLKAGLQEFIDTLEV